MSSANGQGFGLNLGNLAPDVATVEKMLRDRMEYLSRSRSLSGRKQRRFLMFAEYCAAVADLPRHQKDARRRELDEETASYEPPEWGTLDDDFSKQIRARDRAQDRLHIMGPAHTGVADLMRVSGRENLTPDFDGWMRYLGADATPIDRAMAHPRYKRDAVFPERGLTESVLVVAQRGWGKSTLLKALIRQQIEAPRDTSPTGAVVVLDPGGDLARQVARWPELSGPDRAGDRLVYVEPRIQRGLTVGFNPLDGTGLDEESRSDVAGFLVEAIGNLIADLTLAMRNLIRACCRVLLWTPGANLRDLHIMLGNVDQDRDAAALYARACTYPDDDVRGFFLHRFGSDEYRSTKGYLRNRIEEMLLIHDLGGMFAGTATVDLRAAVEARKVILVNLAKFENEEELRTAGRLLATMVIAIAKRRAQTPDAPRPPIHLVIDEATVLAGNELVKALAQCRKYGLNLILAQQVMASGFSPADKETLIKNTGCRFVGGRDRRTVADVLSNGSDVAGTLPKIEPRQFWAEWAGDGPHLLNVRSDLADRGPGISDAEWTAYVAAATAPGSGYYRPTKPLPNKAERPSTPTTNHETMESWSHDSIENGPETASSLDEDATPPPLSSARFGLRKPKAGSGVFPPAPPPPDPAGTTTGDVPIATPAAPKLRKKRAKPSTTAEAEAALVKGSRRKL